MAEHIHCCLSLFQNHISQKRFVLFAFLWFHINENNFIRNRAKAFDFYFHRPAGFSFYDFLVGQ